jgi:acetyl esterase/lipase
MFVYLLLTATVLLLLLAVWVVVPAPSMALLVLGVAVPELSPVLLAITLAVGALMAIAGGGTLRMTGCAQALLAAGLLAVPLVQLPGTVRRFDEAMSAAGVVDPDAGSGRRRVAPFSAVDLVFGLDVGESQISRDVALASPDGEPLTVDVYRPSRMSSRLFPVIVQIYGGGWQRGEPSDDSRFSEYFASRGYAVFAIDYRHAPRWQWPTQLEDVRTALAWVAAHATDYGADPKRAVYVGRSAGAQLALMAAYTTSELPALAVIDFYGPTNLTEGWRMPPSPDPLPVRPTLEAYLGGTPDELPGQYQDASPVTHVTPAVPPTLLLYGARDHIVEARFGRELHERLREAGVTSVLLELPWAEHGFDLAPRGLGLQLSLYYVERFIEWAVSNSR